MFDGEHKSAGAPRRRSSDRARAWRRGGSRPPFPNAMSKRERGLLVAGLKGCPPFITSSSTTVSMKARQSAGQSAPASLAELISTGWFNNTLTVSSCWVSARRTHPQRYQDRGQATAVEHQRGDVIFPAAGRCFSALSNSRIAAASPFLARISGVAPSPRSPGRPACAGRLQRRSFELRVWIGAPSSISLASNRGR